MILKSAAGGSKRDYEGILQGHQDLTSLQALIRLERKAWYSAGICDRKCSVLLFSKWFVQLKDSYRSLCHRLILTPYVGFLIFWSYTNLVFFKVAVLI